MSATMTQSIPIAFRNGMQLLLLAARRPLDGKICAEIRSIGQGTVNWTQLVNMAIAHKTPYLLFQSLKKAFPEGLPDHPALQNLEQRYLLHLRYSLRTTDYLLTLLHQLGEKGILAVPFKGPTLSALAYGEPTLRPIGDLDLLVDRRDAAEAIAFFKARGCRPEVDLDDDQFRAYVAKKNGLVLYDPDRKPNLDLHWEMSANYSFVPLTLDRIKAELIAFDLAGHTVHQPRLETLLVYQCLHGMREGWQHLESVASIAGLIGSHERLDWGWVIRTAEQWRCRRIVLLALVMVQDLFDVTLPEEILTLLEDDPRANRLAVAVTHNLLATTHSGTIPAGRLKFVALHFRVRDRWSEKLRYGRYLLLGTTAEDWRYFPLSGKWSFLHVFLRPMRLGMRLLRGGWG
jgi:hypothetical protein